MDKYSKIVNRMNEGQPTEDEVLLSKIEYVHLKMEREKEIKRIQGQSMNVQGYAPPAGMPFVLPILPYSLSSSTFYFGPTYVNVCLSTTTYDSQVMIKKESFWTQKMMNYGLM